VLGGIVPPQPGHRYGFRAAYGWTGVTKTESTVASCGEDRPEDDRDGEGDGGRHHGDVEGGLRLGSERIEAHDDETVNGLTAMATSRSGREAVGL
jgi:hypothetical protein